MKAVYVLLPFLNVEGAQVALENIEFVGRIVTDEESPALTTAYLDAVARDRAAELD